MYRDLDTTANSSLRTPFSLTGICSERPCLVCNNHAAGFCGRRRPQAFESALHDEMATSVDVAAVHRRIWSAEWLIEQVPVSSESEMSRLCMPSFFVVAALKDGGIVRRRSLPDRIGFSKNSSTGTPRKRSSSISEASDMRKLSYCDNTRYEDETSTPKRMEYSDLAF